MRPIFRSPSLPHALAAGVMFALCAGCGGGATAPGGSTSTEEATVHGKVKIKGAPPQSGRIHFDPTNASRQSAPVASVELQKDGSYTIKTLVGENRVNVESPETRDDPNLSTPQPFVVNSGDNTFNLTLPPP